ncbi:MAG: ABC transporter ATP-binding protein/permease [Solobacterium sp.]|nr:ABC transporter ATP-binding protein/permease [Solobacterium sp.]MCH4049962.1 ABC transporter ATP-binding protein/permease [Solobacterium sp.]MCH4073647.1 ABC transporter ATP-binding protein/permease [Solobacterium sp.]MCI1313136.1 ABC transporter ATP-binding protein/permease [Solobacterium sp.]MCI1346754.1 ABC transporter ATP-binding protein/permease [Solobacterium sp.]
MNRGGLYSLVTKDTETFQQYCSSIIPALVSTGIDFLGTLIFGLILSPILCLVYFVSLIGGIVLQKVLAGTVEKAYQTTWQRQNAFFVQTENVLKNRTAFRTYQKESYGEDAFSDSQNDFNRSSLASDMVAMPLKTIGIGCAILPVIVLCFMGLWLTSTGRVSIAGLLSFYYFCLGSVPDQIHYVDYMLMAKQASVSAAKVTAFLNEEDEAVEQKYYDQETLKSVAFHYPDTDAGVENVTLTIHQGEKVAVVGKNGSGKSTMLKLLLGVYQPDTGTLEGPALDEIAYVPQDQVLFYSPIKEYVSLSHQPDKEKVNHALAETGCIGFVQEKGGIDALIESDSFSGGQKQRLDLARSMYSERPYIFMDEPSAALDTAFEMELEELLMKETDRTIVVTTHRLDLVRHFDNIIVMKDHHIAECGTHEQVLARNGIYAAMYHRQKNTDH